MEKPSHKGSMEVGRTAYLIESGRRVREVVVCGRAGQLYTVRFTDTVGGIRLRPDRLYPTREAAQADLRQRKAEAQQLKSAPNLWHNAPLWQC